MALVSANLGLVGTRDEGGATEIQIAMNTGHKYAVPWLKSNGGVNDVFAPTGADPKATQDDRFTPMMAAGQHGGATNAALLVRHRAGRDTLNNEGRSVEGSTREAGLELTVL